MFKSHDFALLEDLERGVRFDREFVRLMREQLSDPNLDIVWDDTEKRARAATAEEVAECNMLEYPDGAWVLISAAGKTPISVAGVGWARVNHSVVVRILDGAGGWPLVPGIWLIERTGALNIRTHGRTILHAHDKMRAAVVAARHHAIDAMAHFTAHDEETRRGALREASERGVITPSIEDYRRIHAEAERRYSRHMDLRNQQLREAQLWFGVGAVPEGF